MKKQLFSFVLLWLASAWCATQGHAEDIGINIGGKEVTTENLNNITAAGGFDALKQGTIVFDKDKKTLTLTDVIIEATGENAGLRNEKIDGLTILFEGTNRISSTKAAIGVTKATTLKGGKVELKAGDTGVFMNGVPVVIDHCDMTIEGKWGIAGWNGRKQEHLTFVETTARVKGNGVKGSICDLASVTFIGCKIVSHETAAYDASLYGIAVDGKLVTDEIFIQPTETGLGLFIGGVQLTSKNYTDISKANGFASINRGSISFDPTKKILVLNGIDIDGKEQAGISNNGIANLTIECKGNNSIKSDKQPGMVNASGYDMTVKGSNLTCTSTDSCGIFVKGSLLTIANTDLTAKGTEGIAGTAAANGEKVTIINSTTHFTGNLQLPSINHLSALVLEGCEIKSPAGAVFDQGEGCVVLDGKPVTDEIIIGIDKNGIVLHYDGDPDSGIGTGDEAQFIAAIRLTPDELTPYYGKKQISAVKYHIAEAGPTGISIRVYGNGSSTQPGNMLVDEPSEGLQVGWHTYTLAKPVVLESGDYWVGYEMTTSKGFPAGTDTGPCEKGKGGWFFSENITDNTWVELPTLNADLNLNWNIRVYITDITDGISPATSKEKHGPTAIYSLDGVKQETLQHGINIVRKEDGRTVKVMR